MTPFSSTPSVLTLDPADLTPHESYKLMIGSIVPRPIAFVSTQSSTGVLNLSPYSFFNGVCSKPPTLLFSTTRRGSDGAKKDTLVNIEAMGEFVVNVVTESIVEAMNQTSAEYPPEVSEFAQVGLTTVPSEVVTPPRVLESPVNMECTLNQIVHVGDGTVGSGSIIIGTIVRFHVREDLMANGRIKTEALKPVGRMAGASYCRIPETFELPRPTL